MIPSDRVRILIATNLVDFRKGQDGLAAVVQSALREDPFAGAVFVFRAKRTEQLARQGLVTRTTDRNDARRAVAKLTKKGFDLIDTAVGEHVETQKALLAAFSEDEIATLDGALRKLMKAAEKD
ncbi:IS66 family insertion sequence element accessory protein TnpB [Meridianimarinicoccus sp. MJW13]|uniref:IS66 family insertion sequence element accessory protein TnpB n=1 Tax=Meridianimarinicoccus sp. MJW13 TaxID=2720031 RepID=UPI0018672C38|nr:IS66 family insertion sequence element accessory protein TnpB [Fluviibacterium sp. MJW13]